jgi:hypothetical protein
MKSIANGSFWEAIWLYRTSVHGRGDYVINAQRGLIVLKLRSTGRLGRQRPVALPCALRDSPHGSPLQRTRNITHEVINVFAADAESNEPLTNCITTPPCAPLCRGMHSAEACGLADQGK